VRGGGRAVVLGCGDFFFRWRSYLPLILAPLLAAAVVRSQLAFDSRDDLVWEIGCVLLALAGVALRAWTVGVAAPGTSGRNTREQKAASLTTTGPYSLVRHPLYLANSIIALGLALFPHAWIAPPLVATLTAVYYACIAEREDQYLRERFGAAWFYALGVVLVVPLLLDVGEDLHETGAFDLDPVWTATAVLGGALFAALRFLKKRTSLLDVPRRAEGRDRPAT